MLRTAIFLICAVNVVVDATTCPTLGNAITQKDILHAVRASQEVYNDNVVEGSTINQTPFTVVKKIHENLHTDAGIRVLVADHGNTRMIIYRGTDGGAQLLIEGGSVFQRKTVVRYGNQDVKILKFFWEAFELVSYGLRPYITDPSKKYIITGHSLGGAMASIMALNGTQLYQGSMWANPQSSLITFGQPRTGEQTYANLHDSLISTYRKLRFVYMGDIVARNPGHEFGWRHHSRAVYMGEEKTGGWFGGWFGDEMEDQDMNAIDEELEDFLDSDEDEIQDEFETTEDENEAEFKALEALTLKSVEDEEVQDSNMRKFWTICSTQRAYKCITYLKHFIPSINHHAIANYVKSAEETHVFRTMKGTEKSNFNTALVAACQELEG
ncbi:uncharacterized protein [Clytia hemisphaerica]|uniref:Fungal lipase-type domain-containing protein n=1 Tax=Clytia hemisphaerica TaxID=252671 RepID=A0A7M5X857_9CNID